MDFKNSILILLIVLFVPSTLAWPFSGYSAADHDNKPPGCEDYQITTWLSWAHVDWMFLFWGPMVDIAVILIMFFKHQYSFYQGVHVALTTIIDIGSLVLIISKVWWKLHFNMSFLNDMSSKPLHQIYHGIAGITLAVIIVIMQSIGFYVWWWGKDINKMSTTYLQFKQAKRYLGYLSFVLAKTSLISGTLITGKKGGIWWWMFDAPNLYYAFIAYEATVVVLLVLFYIYSITYPKVFLKSMAREQKVQVTDNHKQILNMINNGETSYAIKQMYPKIHWCTFGNLVLDITEFSHPGGQYLTQKCYGRDVQRFLIGSYHLEEFGNREAYRHSEQAFAIAKSFRFGKIKQTNENNILNSINGKQGKMSTKQGKLNGQTTSVSNDEFDLSSPLDDQEDDQEKSLIEYDALKVSDSFENFNIDLSSAKLYESKEWQISQSQDLSDTTSVLFLKNRNYRVDNWKQGTKWMGRHFALSFKNNPEIVRQYTICQSFSKTNQHNIKNLICFYDVSKNRQSLNPNEELQPLNEDFKSDTLQFVVKRYDFNSKCFSKTLVDQFRNNTFDIGVTVKGPLGSGFNLDIKKGGHYVFICGGTGILPFLDLFYYLLKSTLMKYFKDSQPQMKKRFDNYNIKYQEEEEETTDEQKLNPLKITFFGAFKTDQDFIGKDIVDNLHRICKNEKINLFSTAYLRISQQNNEQQYSIPLVNERFDREFFNARVSNDTEQFFVCGSPVFNQNIPKALMQNQIDENKITLF